MKLLMILLMGIGIFAFSGCGESAEEKLAKEALEHQEKKRKERDEKIKELDAKLKKQSEEAKESIKKYKEANNIK